jgi:N-acetylglutamate synthase-like GNAT family acetyltransferase
MPATMLVRQARPEDAPAVESLYRQLVQGDNHIRVDPQRLRDLANHASNQLFVVEREGVVCGTAFVTICLDPMYGFAPYAVAEHIIVAADARKTGAGRALMAAIEDHARAAHCTRLGFMSSAFRTEAHAFFSHMGYDGDKKRGFVKYLNRVPALRATAGPT